MPMRSRARNKLRSRVPDSERKLPIHALQARGAVLLIKVQQDLGIRVGPEPVSATLQVGTQLRIIEDLSVEHDPPRAVLVGDGLPATGDIDDAEPRASHRGSSVAIHPEL